MIVSSLDRYRMAVGERSREILQAAVVEAGCRRGELSEEVRRQINKYPLKGDEQGGGMT
jgi:hypothetical protein